MACAAVSQPPKGPFPAGPGRGAERVRVRPGRGLHRGDRFRPRGGRSLAFRASRSLCVRAL